MDAKTRIHKKHSTTFDYEKEMEKALSAIFHNLRGIEENRFRITSNQRDPSEIVKTRSTSEPTVYIELPLASQKPDPEPQEQIHTEQVTNVKSRRRLPEVPKRKSCSSIIEWKLNYLRSLKDALSGRQFDANVTPRTSHSAIQAIETYWINFDWSILREYFFRDGCRFMSAWEYQLNLLSTLRSKAGARLESLVFCVPQLRSHALLLRLPI